MTGEVFNIKGFHIDIISDVLKWIYDAREIQYQLVTFT